VRRLACLAEKMHATPPGRGAAVHQPQDGRSQPRPRLPQARHPHAGRTWRAPGEPGARVPV